MKLCLEDISVNISGKRILHSINLQVEEGAFVSLLGPSGCGKSTLLKTITGILPHISGTIILDGSKVDKVPPHKRGAVIVFQDMRLFPHLTAAENVGFPLRMQGVAQREYLRVASELLERVQLDGLDGRKPNAMSGGQQQRVALARALAAKPAILLLDEPFTGLDENLRDDMRHLVLELHKEFGMTTVLVTHDKREALAMSDNIVVMSEGRILQMSTPKQLYEAPNSREVAEYFGEANFVKGTQRNGVFYCPLFGFPYEAVDGEYVAMIRPYALEVVSGEEYILTQTMYGGDYIEAIFRHQASGILLTCKLMPDNNIKLGDTANIVPIADKVKLIR
jgi:ABC-type Fe3+/spermidine/putrescine transport system ATPase subunit